MYEVATIVAGNWKMNTDLERGTYLARLIAERDSTVPGVQMVLCPPFTHLYTVKSAVRQSDVLVGAQDMHPELEGAFTGEISPLNLSSLCDYVIVGHSERRQLFGETNEYVALKVASVIEYEMIPILCVGETLEEREEGKAAEAVSRQVSSAIAGLNMSEIDALDLLNMIVAYEPVWAIGTGRAATPEIADEMMNGVIRGAIQNTFGPEAAQVVPLLYGGSVNPGNAPDFAAVPGINGALVGGASLDADSFLAVAAAFAEADG